MAKKLGNDYRLFVESAVAGTYNEIKGQQDLSESRSVDKIDLSTKDTGRYKVEADGQASVSFALGLIPDLPDANGYSRLETVAKTYPSQPVGIQIRHTPFGNTDVVFEADVTVSLTGRDYPRNGAVTASYALSLYAEPTVDELK